MVLDSNRASYSIMSNANDDLILAPKGPDDCFRNIVALARRGEERPSTVESTKEYTLAVKVTIACLPPPPTLTTLYGLRRRRLMGVGEDTLSRFFR